MSEIKVLGVIVDSRLRWEAQAAQAAQKGEAAFNALSRITSSVSGPSLRQSRLIYSAVVRPTMLYGSQVWGTRNDSQPMAKSLMGRLEKVQNKYLRKITGGYKRSPTTVLEKESGIFPLDLYVQAATLRYEAATQSKPVTADIVRHVKSLWNDCVRNRRTFDGPRRKKISMEIIRRKAEAKVAEAQRSPQRLGRTSQQGSGEDTGNDTAAIRKWLNSAWRLRWMVSKSKRNRSAAVWETVFGQSTLRLFGVLKKHESTALCQLRSEVIGFDACLASVGVPGITPQCMCGANAQSSTFCFIILSSSQPEPGCFVMLEHLVSTPCYNQLGVAGLVRVWRSPLAVSHKSSLQTKSTTRNMTSQKYLD